MTSAGSRERVVLGSLPAEAPKLKKASNARKQTATIATGTLFLDLGRRAFDLLRHIDLIGGRPKKLGEAIGLPLNSS